MRRAKNLRVCVVFSIVAIMCGVLAHADDSLQTVMTNLEKKSETVTSYKADIAMTIDMMGQKMESKGTVVFQKPDKSRMELDMDMGSMTMKQVFVNDGVTVWTYQPMMKMVTKIDVKKVQAETQNDSVGNKNDISKPFAGFVEDSIKFVGEEMIGNDRVFVFKGIPDKTRMQNMNLTPSEIEMWIGDENGLVRRMILYTEDGEEMMRQSYDNIAVNVNVDDDTFRFTPPEGVQVQDMTEGAINMMKEMNR